MDIPNQELQQQNSYILSDEELAQLNEKNFYSTKKFDGKCRKSIFHIFFLNSIYEVKEKHSFNVLLRKLQMQLESGVYHFPLNDIDILFKTLFIDLPNYKPFQICPELMDFLFKLMNIFMGHFYYLAFPFFYQRKTEDNIFSYDSRFIIKYFFGFSSVFMLKKNLDEDQYIGLIKKDGSLNNIFDYLFGLYSNGEYFNEVSNCLYQLMQWIDYTFLIEYLGKKNYFNKCLAIFPNQTKNSIIRMNFPIAFFTNFFTKNYPKLDFKIQNNNNEDERSIQQRQLKNDVCLKINQDIDNFHIYKYLESFLSSYIDQLILEKRFNAANPFHPDIFPNQNENVKFYPEQANDNDIMDIFNLFLLMFRTIYDPNLQSQCFNFFPIICSVFSIIPDIFSNDAHSWTITLLEYFRLHDPEKCGVLVNVFIEAIQNRLAGNFIFNENIKNARYIMESQDKNSNSPTFLRDIIRDSIKSFLQCLFSNNNSFINTIEFYQRLNIVEIEHIKELFSILIQLSKISTNVKEPAFTAFIFYSSIMEKIIDLYIELFFAMKLEKDDYKEIYNQGIFVKLMMYILNMPNPTQYISSKSIFDLCNICGEYINVDPSFEQMINIAVSSGDIFKLKIISIILKYGSEQNYKAYTSRITKFIVDQAQNVGQISNLDLVQRILSISPFLIYFKYDQQYLGLFKECLNCLNTMEQNKAPMDIIYLDYFDKMQYALEFKNKLHQAKINLVYCMANSYGFEVKDDCIALISFLLNNYGMCVEVLNVISNIIGFLAPFIKSQDPAIILPVSSLILDIMQILNENYPNPPPPEIQKQLPLLPEYEEKPNSNYKTEYHFALYPFGYDYLIRKQRDMQLHSSGRDKNRNGPPTDDDIKNAEFEEERMRQIEIKRLRYQFQKERQEPKMKDSGEDEWNQFDFTKERCNDRFWFINDNEKILIVSNCFFSCHANPKDKLNNHFQLLYPEKKSPNLKEIEKEARKAVNYFLRNIADYFISWILQFGINFDHFFDVKGIILSSLRGGLVRPELLRGLIDLLFRMPDKIFSEQQEVNGWLEVIVERISKLIISKDEWVNEATAMFEVGSRSEQLDIFLHLLKKLDIIFPGLIKPFEPIILKYGSRMASSFKAFFEETDEHLIDEIIKEIATSKNSQFISHL